MGPPLDLEKRKIWIKNRSGDNNPMRKYYWHKYPTGREIDYIRTSELLSKGFTVLRLWECEINVMDLNNFQYLLKNYAENRSK